MRVVDPNTGSFSTYTQLHSGSDVRNGVFLQTFGALSQNSFSTSLCSLVGSVISCRGVVGSFRLRPLTVTLLEIPSVPKLRNISCPWSGSGSFNGSSSSGAGNRSFSWCMYVQLMLDEAQKHSLLLDMAVLGCTSCCGE